MTKQLIKKIVTKNHKLALNLFKKYNSPEYPTNFSTISKQKGGDKTLSYIVLVYELLRSET